MSVNNKSSDADNLDMTKRRFKMLSLSKEVKIIDLKRNEKGHILRSTVRRNLLSVR